ncbi:MAG: hypothetical protein O7H41_15795 [Planctomycetota bacterium]|nr:hypothetical protein [Planctomycetota bacterium]
MKEGELYGEWKPSDSGKRSHFFLPGQESPACISASRTSKPRRRHAELDHCAECVRILKDVRRLWIGLYMAESEVEYEGYSREQIHFGKFSGSYKNFDRVYFSPAPPDWGQVDGIGIFLEPTGGEPIMGKAYTTKYMGIEPLSVTLDEE